MTRDLIFCHGTWGRNALWNTPGSDVAREAAGWGFRVHHFKWSGILGGVAAIRIGLLPEGDHEYAHLGADKAELLPWLDAAEKFVLFCRGLGDPSVLLHSHARQLVLFALALGQPLDVVVDVSGPVREDMRRAQLAGLSRKQQWVHFFDPVNDETIRAGQWFDGVVSRGVTDPHATNNIDTTGSGHSGLLLDPELRQRYKLWESFAEGAP